MGKFRKVLSLWRSEKGLIHTACVSGHSLRFQSFPPGKSCRHFALQCKKRKQGNLLVEAIWVSIHWSYAKNHPSRYQEVILEVYLPSLETKHFTPQKKTKQVWVGSFPFATIFVGLWQLVFTAPKRWFDPISWNVQKCVKLALKPTPPK